MDMCVRGIGVYLTQVHNHRRRAVDVAGWADHCKIVLGTGTQGKWKRSSVTNFECRMKGMLLSSHLSIFYSILLYSTLFYSILFYSILFYSILFYSILFYSILFYLHSIY